MSAKCTLAYCFWCCFVCFAGTAHFEAQSCCGAELGLGGRHCAQGLLLYRDVACLYHQSRLVWLDEHNCCAGQEFQTQLCIAGLLVAGLAKRQLACVAACRGRCNRVSCFVFAFGRQLEVHVAPPCTCLAGVSFQPRGSCHCVQRHVLGG